MAIDIHKIVNQIEFDHLHLSDDEMKELFGNIAAELLIRRRALQTGVVKIDVENDDYEYYKSKNEKRHNGCMPLVIVVLMMLSAGFWYFVINSITSIW